MKKVAKKKVAKKTQGLTVRVEALPNVLASRLPPTSDGSELQVLPDTTGTVRLPNRQNFAVVGDLRSTSNVCLDSNALLVVTGVIHCKNLLMAYGATLICGGLLEVDEVLWVCSGDVVAEAHGPVKARAAMSGGGGGWLTCYHADVQIAALESYINDRTGSLSLKGEVGAVHSLLRNDMLDESQWLALDEEERAELAADYPEERWEYVRVDEGKLFDTLRQGGSILK